MNIAFIIGADFKLGGQMKSCISLASEIIIKGHSVKFFGYGYSKDVELLLKNRGLELIFWKPYNELNNEEKSKTNFFTYSKKTLQNKLRENNIEFVHLQDYESTKDGLWAVLRLGLPYVITIPGGPVERGKILLNNMPVILYSKEQINWYESRPTFLRPHIYHIIARIDHSYFKNVPPKKYNTREALTFLLPIRLDSDKMEIIMSAIRLIIKMGKDKEVKLSIMGEGNIKDELEMIIISNGWENIKIVSPQYSDIDLQENFQKADFLIGIGRVIMESISMMIPVICMGESGEFALVTSENIGMISDFNFSGRHFRSQSFDYEKEYNNLLIKIQDLDNLLKTNYKYAVLNLAANKGATQLLDIYISLYNDQLKFKLTLLGFIKWFIVKKLQYFFKSN